MEDRAISLKATVKVLSDLMGETGKDGKLILSDAISWIRELESVEPKRETGYWKVVPSYDKYGEYRPNKYACSKCGWTVDLCRGLQQEEGYKLFCEHCGTDLRKRRF